MAYRPHPREKLKKKPFLERLRYRLEYMGFVVLEVIIRRSPKKISLMIGRFIGRIAWYFDRQHRRTALANVGAAYIGEKSLAETREIARNNFIHIAQTAVDLVRATEITRDNFNDYFIYEGTELLERELEKCRETGKGFIFLFAHLGSQEMLVGHIFKYGAGKENVVTKRIRNPYIDYYIQSQREKLGVKVLPHRGSGKEIVKRFLNGELVFFATDQRPSYYEAVRCKFFGQHVLAHKAIAQLALTLDLTVMPIFAIRNGDGKYQIKYQVPIGIVKTGDITNDTVKNTQLFQDCVERMVRLYPEQWWWAHDRWKHGDEDESKDETDE